MIFKAKSTKLVEIFFYVSDAYEKEHKFSCERFSNNSSPEFTDQEIMTVYLFCISQEQRTKIKQIYTFADEYLRSWFPKLPSYAAFNNRINRLSEAFRLLTASLLRTRQPSDCFISESLLDSGPVITCLGKRIGRVAPGLTEKGFCSTKSLYYYGLKLHVLAFRRENQLPFPEQLLITPASESDLNVFKNAWQILRTELFMVTKFITTLTILDSLLQVRML